MISSVAFGLDHPGDEGNYGLEVLCANWTPMVAAPMVATLAEPVTRACELLVDAATSDIDDFLMRFYRSQRG